MITARCDSFISFHSFIARLDVNQTGKFPADNPPHAEPSRLGVELWYRYLWGGVGFTDGGFGEFSFHILVFGGDVVKDILVMANVSEVKNCFHI